MSAVRIQENGLDTRIELTVPQEVFEDLQKVALFNKVSVGDLVYSYTIDSLASDARTVNRVKFQERLDANAHHDSFLTKTPREILNEFNLLY